MVVNEKMQIYSANIRKLLGEWKSFRREGGLNKPSMLTFSDAMTGLIYRPNKTTIMTIPSKTADHIAILAVRGPRARAPRGLNVVSIFSNA